MGKKRKKTPQPPAVASAEGGTTQVSSAVEVEASMIVAETAAPPTSQPALTEEKAAELLAEAAPEPEPTPAPTPIADAVEAVAEPEPEPTPKVIVAEGVPASEALPETTRPKKKILKKKKRKSVAPTPTREALDQKIDRLEAKLDKKKEEAAKAAREGFGSNPALDDTSVPPVDLEIHDEFFAAGEHVSHPPKDASGAYSAVDARHAQKMTPQAHARRAHLSRYVMWAVGGAAALLMLGITIKSFRGRTNEEPVHHAVAHVAQPVETAAAAVQPEQAVAQVANQAPLPEAKTDEPKVDDTKAADTAKPEDSADKSAAEQPKDMPPEKPKTAWQEKQAAKAALERSANGAAIAAGERAVALDASDAESWLVLGAAYQAMGNVGQAKRCFHSCVAQGRKGPVSDCRDMLAGM